MKKVAVIAGASLAVRAALTRMVAGECQVSALAEPVGPSPTASPPPYPVVVMPHINPPTGKRKAQWKTERRGRR